MKADNDHEEQAENTSSWMTTYSDMVTLLFAFFVLLFAISNVDAQKFSLLAAGLSKDGITAEQFIEIQEKYNMDGVGIPDPDDIQYPAPGEDSQSGQESELDTLHELILDYISENQLNESVAVIYNGERLMLTLTNDVWFVSGSAEITPEMQEKAEILGHLLQETHNEENPFDVIVVGHTDNRPINTARYPSNWYLSADRALKFLDTLLQHSELSPNRFSARGCAETMPIGDNETDEGRQANRRVEVLITQSVGEE